MNRRHWTPEEDDLLRAFFASPDCPFAELASRLGRSIESVRQRATIRHLRLSPEARSEIARARWNRVSVEKRKTAGRHLVALKQEQRHRALSADAPPWCKLVRAAVEESFDGDYWKAAEACWPEAQSPGQRRSRKNQLWEIMRGWKYVYSKKDGQRVRKRQPILYLLTATVNRLCTGLSLDREKLLAALEASGGGLLEERRSEIARQLDRPLAEIKNPYQRKVKKQQIKRSAEARRGKGRNPKNQARLHEWWEGLKQDPQLHERAKDEVASKLARFHHPSPTDRMLRGWRILVARCRRRGHDPSPDDIERFVQKWVNGLGVKPDLIRRLLDRFQGKPHGGWEPNLDYFLMARVMRDAGLSWPEVTDQLAAELGVRKDPGVFRREYARFARKYFRSAKRRMVPFRPRRRWEADQISEFRALYTSGVPIEEIEVRFGRTRSALKTLATRLSIRRPPTPANDSHPSP